jgi:tetratricopeptide (TPR) repeat protein
MLERPEARAERGPLLYVLSLLDLRQSRYHPSANGLHWARDYVEFAEHAGDPAEASRAYFLVAFVHLWRDELDEAELWYQKTLEVSRRIGELTQEVRALTYLAVVSRRRGDPDAVTRSAGEALRLAAPAGMPEYVGIARGNLAWAAWRRGEMESARADAEACWNALVAVPAVPFFWIGVWPLLAVRLAQGEEDGCAELARRMLQPDQMKLPDDLEDPLAGAVEAWEAGDATAAGDLLRTAVARAKESGWGWL